MNDAAMPRVLLVEDDPTSRAFLAAAIKALPARVDEVDSVAAAVARATATRHDLWLVDAHLPDGTGHAVLRALRGLHPDTIALAHTASSESDVAASLRAAGFADVLVKPLSATTLQSAVRARRPRGRIRRSRSRRLPPPCDRAPRARAGLVRDSCAGLRRSR